MSRIEADDRGEAAPARGIIDAVLRGLIFAAALIVPVVVAPTHLDAFRFPKEKTYLAFAILVVAWLAIALLFRGRTLFAPLRKHRDVLWLTAAICAWAVLTTLTSTNRVLSLQSLIWVLTCALMFVATLLVAERFPNRWLLWLMFVPAALNASLAVVQRAGIYNPMMFEERVTQRIRTTALSGNPNDVATYLLFPALAALAMALIVGRSSLRPRREDWRLEWRLFREILRVGAISSLNALQTVVTAVIITGFVGRYGPAALAGYGVGLRLELLQIPLVFAVGQALVVLVGVNIGAGRATRAKHIAWIGAGFAAAICLAIGVTVAVFPAAWVGLFSSDAAVLESGSRYLRTVAPFYPLLAAGIALYFASQGAGRVLPPMLAGTVRLALVIAGGLAAVSLQGVFVVIAAAIIAYGALTVWFVAAATWK